MNRSWLSAVLGVMACFALLAPAAFADSSGYQVVSSCGGVNYPTGPVRPGTQDTTGKGCINGTFSGSVSTAAFAPTGQANLSTGTVTSNVALGSVGPTAVITNNGAVTAYVNFGGSGVTATTSSYPVNSGQSIAFNVGANTYIAGITASGTAPLSITTGTGTPTLAGGTTAGAPANVTVNAPPNDVLSGPTNVPAPGDVIVNSQGAGSVGLQITGTFTGLSGIVRGSVDGTNYFNLPAWNQTTGTAVPAGTAITAVGSWFVCSAGWRDVEFHVTAVSTGTAVVSLNSSAGSCQPQITPTGASNVDIGGVNGATVDTGNGVVSTHTMRVSLASNSTGQTIGASTTAAHTCSTAAYTRESCLGQIDDDVKATGTVQGAGTAGSADTHVLTIQGIASMTKLLVTPDSVALPANQSVNVAQFNGVTPLMNNGVSGTGSQRVNIASDNTAFSVNPQATSTTGVSTKSLQVANNTTSVAVDASAGTLLAVRVFNNSATIAYAKFYNASQGSTTCGSGTPVNRILIPASTSGAGAVFALGGGFGVAYGTAITVCVTTGFADADTTAPAASAYIVEADYK